MSLNEKRIVFSGFRDELLKALIERKQGRVTTAISNLTDILIVKKVGQTSTKITQAKEKGIEIIHIDDFLLGQDPWNRNTKKISKNFQNSNSKRVPNITDMSLLQRRALFEESKDK